MKVCSPPEFLQKNLSHEQLLLKWSIFRDSSMGAKLKIFEKLMKVWSPPEFFHKNMSHEQSLFTWSTFCYSSVGAKLKYFRKAHKTVTSVWIFSQKHVSRKITFHMIHISWFYCCDRKSRAAYAQSFTLWQQATIEFTCHDHSSHTLLLRSIVDIVSITRDYTPQSLYYCLFAPHIWMVLFFMHIPFVVNHTFNATPPERLQQLPLLFATNHTDRSFFVWRLNSARPSHPGHSTISLRSEIPSDICAKLHTVAASNNRVHMPWSLFAYAIVMFNRWHR